MFKFLKIILFFILVILIIAFCFCFVGKIKPAENIKWGAVFSQKHSEAMGLDWKENYLAILDDLKIRDLKVVAYWDLIEKQPDEFDFSDLDWQIREAEKRGAEILLVVGRKVPRWPECHWPDWAKSLEDEELKQRVLNYVQALVLRYRNSPAVIMWQVENEPLYPFGECQLLGSEFLQQEIDLVRSISDKPIVISDSGEYSTWFKAAQLGDIMGTTLYKRVWFKELGIYVTYPFQPIYYARKAWLIDKLFNKKVICVELQAEPWGKVLLYDLPIEEHSKSMDLERFKYMVKFAENTGLDTFYLWGAEWWYWLKVEHNDSAIWDEAKEL